MSDSVLNEIFGEENFLCCVTWKRRQVADNRNKNNVSTDHEYIIVYGKNAAAFNGSEKDLSNTESRRRLARSLDE